jgi:hypothetical protein
MAVQAAFTFEQRGYFALLGRAAKSPHDYGCTHAIKIIGFRLKR